MINEQNSKRFSTLKNQTQIDDLKHRFYYLLNRRLQDLPENAKYVEIEYRYESILHLVNKELNEAGYHSLLFVKSTDQGSVVMLRILIKE